MCVSLSVVLNFWRISGKLIYLNHEWPQFLDAFLINIYLPSNDQFKNTHTAVIDII